MSANRRWDKFEDSYRTMLFSNGDKCWNGPDRSMKVMAIMLLHWIMHSAMHNNGDMKALHL